MPKKKIQDLTKDRNNLLEDFKGLGRRYKGLEDKIKGNAGHMSKKAKLTIDEKEALEEQRKKTDYWKGRTQKLKGKMIEERKMWEHKYETATGKQSQEIAGLKFKLRVKKIEQVELSQSIQNTIQSMEQSLKEHMDYIILLREQDVSKTVEYERVLGSYAETMKIGKHSAWQGNSTSSTRPSSFSRQSVRPTRCGIRQKHSVENSSP